MKKHGNKTTNKLTLSFHQKILAATSLTIIFLYVLSPYNALANDCPDSVKYDECVYLATHNAFANPAEGYTGPTLEGSASSQAVSITKQLDAGVRVLLLDMWRTREGAGDRSMIAWPIGSSTNCRIYNFAGISEGDFTDCPVEDQKTNAPDAYYNGRTEIVVAHGAWTVGYLGMHAKGVGNFTGRYRTLKEEINFVVDWLDANPGEVVTLDLENQVNFNFQQEIWDAFDTSKAKGKYWRVGDEHPTLTDANGDAWDIKKAGFPTLGQLKSANTRLVIVHDRQIKDANWRYANEDYRVRSVYGDKSLIPATWLDSTNSTSLASVLHPLFQMEHNKETSGVGRMDWINGNIAETRHLIPPWNQSLQHHWDDIEGTYNRIPTYITVDFFPYADGSIYPLQLVKQLAALKTSYATQRPLPGYIENFPSENQYGWNNTEAVIASLTAFGSKTKAITYCVYAKDNDLCNLQVACYDDPGCDAQHSFKEGVVTMSMGEIDTKYISSDRTFKKIKIDITPPIINGTPNPGTPNNLGWYKDDVTVTFACNDPKPEKVNENSLIDICESPILVNTDGAHQITGQAIDKANNRTTSEPVIVNLDKTGPILTSAADPAIISPPNGKVVKVVFSGSIRDTTSGIDLSNPTTFSVEDEYGEIASSGDATILTNDCEVSLSNDPCNYSFSLLLKAKRKGTDKDGRLYNISLTTADKSGNISSIIIPVIVSHDKR